MRPSVERLLSEIRALENDERRQEQCGMTDYAYNKVRRTLRCHRDDWFQGLATHPRIVAIGLTIAVLESEERKRND